MKHKFKVGDRVLLLHGCDDEFLTPGKTAIIESLNDEDDDLSYWVREEVNPYEDENWCVEEEYIELIGSPAHDTHIHHTLTIKGQRIELTHKELRDLRNIIEGVFA